MFNTVPYNSFPASSELLNKLDAVAKAIDDMPTYTSNDRAFLDKWEVDLPILQEDVNDLNEQKANQITIAQFFNSESSYDVGDLVYYNGLSYRCTNAHEGEWDADDFVPTTIANELDTLKSGLTKVIRRKNLPIQTATIGSDFENVVSISDLADNGYLDVSLLYGGYYYICRLSSSNAYQKSNVTSAITLELEMASTYVRLKLVGASTSGTVSNVTQDYVL